MGAESDFLKVLSLCIGDDAARALRCKRESSISIYAYAANFHLHTRAANMEKRRESHFSSSAQMKNHVKRERKSQTWHQTQIIRRAKMFCLSQGDMRSCGVLK
jgi:hypothetical protein